MHIKGLHIKSFKGLEDIQVDNLGQINAFVGRNNSGKSSILHAIDVAFLAITVGRWDQFQPKLDIKDIINDAGIFEINVTFNDDSELVIKSRPDFGSLVQPAAISEQKLKSILVLPDIGTGMLHRIQYTPRQIFQFIANKNFSAITHSKYYTLLSIMLQEIKED